MAGLAGWGTAFGQEDDDISNNCYLDSDGSDPTAAWTIDAASQIELNESNTVPVVEGVDAAAPGLHV